MMFGSRITLAIVVSLFAATSFGQVRLHPTLPQEVTQQSSINKRITQTLSINGNDITSEVEDHALLEAKYGKRDGDALLPIEYRYASWQVDVDVNGDKIHFDAANPDDEPGDSPIAVLLDGYRKIAKTPFTLLVDEKLQVADFRGWDAILDGLDDKSKALHSEMFDVRYLCDLWNAEFDRLPVDAVKPGDSWERKMEARFQGGQSMTFTTLYTYVGPVERNDRKFEQVDAKTTAVQYSMNADDSTPLVVSDSDLKVVAAEGELLFDPKRRQVASVKEKLHIQGDLKFTITANDKELPGKLDLQIETEQLLLP